MVTGARFTTKNHAIIRHWIETRFGQATRLKTPDVTTYSGELHVDFDDGEPRPHLEPITWERFFQIFDNEELVFVYEEQTSDGRPSQFFRFLYH